MKNEWVRIAAQRLFDVLQRGSERPLPVSIMENIIREAHDEFAEKPADEAVSEECDD